MLDVGEDIGDRDRWEDKEKQSSLSKSNSDESEIIINCRSCFSLYTGCVSVCTSITVCGADTCKAFIRARLAPNALYQFHSQQFLNVFHVFSSLTRIKQGEILSIFFCKRGDSPSDCRYFCFRIRPWSTRRYILVTHAPRFLNYHSNMSWRK